MIWNVELVIFDIISYNPLIAFISKVIIPWLEIFYILNLASKFFLSIDSLKTSIESGYFEEASN